MENHFPKDIVGVIRDFMYGQKNKQSHLHKNVMKEIQWLRNIYMTKLMRPNDPLVKNMEKPPLPQKLHFHFCVQMSVEYWETVPDTCTEDWVFFYTDVCTDDESSSELPLYLPNVSEEEFNELHG